MSEPLSEHGWTRETIEKKIAQERAALDRLEKMVFQTEQNIKTLMRELDTLPAVKPCQS